MPIDTVLAVHSGLGGILRATTRPPGVKPWYPPAPPDTAQWYVAKLTSYTLIMAHDPHGVWVWKDIHGQYNQVIGPALNQP